MTDCETDRQSVTLVFLVSDYLSLHAVIAKKIFCIISHATSKNNLGHDSSGSKHKKGSQEIVRNCEYKDKRRHKSLQKVRNSN